MKLRTELPITKVEDLIDYDTKLLSIGSCFADNIGTRLQNSGFDISVNPLGIIFNPFSILNSLIGSMNDIIDNSMIIERSGHFYHYNYHSDITSKSESELNHLIRKQQAEIKSKLISGDILQITFGTAWVYQLINSDKIVANCHKVQQNQFKKTLLNLDIIKSIYSTYFDDLFKKNPKLKVILTVSPVRHTKDGLVENNISKSILTLLSDHLSLTYKNVYYFPAYELVIDDLRDYRFYKEDMVHPSDQAIDYVFEAYKKSYFSDKTKELVRLSEKIQKAASHRFMNATANEIVKHKVSIDNMRAEFEALKRG